jgi:hypothetical protein
MPLFLVLDVRKKPVGVPGDRGETVAWVLGGLILVLFVVFLLMTRSDKQESERYRSRRMARALKKAGGSLNPPHEPADGAPPAADAGATTSAGEPPP